MPTETIIETILAFALAIAGGAMGISWARSHRQLCALISIGAGTLLGVTLFGILPEILESLSWITLVLGLASGYALFSIITKYIFHVCPACAASHFDKATAHRYSEIARGMMLALAIHCTVDGLAIAAGHDDHEGANRHGIGLSIVLAICIHKIPEGLALGSLLLGAGFKRSAIIGRVIAVESTTLLGGIAGAFFLPHVSDTWLALALANAGGGFIFLAVHAVLGEIARNHKPLVLANFAAGFGLIGAVSLLLRFVF